MKERIKCLIDIADFLDDAGTKALLEKWAVNLTKGNKILPFVGRFSSGKSSLLNVLLGEALLPTGRVETTAALTKIHYASQPEALIHYKDGSQKSIDVSKIVDLTHNKMEESENSIVDIELLLPLDILKGGLTIVDSPGMDTIVNNHVTLAQFIMNEALLVVYVMSGAPSQFDMSIMRQLQKNGVGIIAVRTHLDDIKFEEESFLDVLKNDEKILSELNEKIEYFALSTQKDATGAGKEERLRFENYLKSDIARRLDEVFAARLSQRLDKIALRFKDELSKRREFILKNVSKTKDEVEKNLLSIENAKLKLEKSISEQKESLSKEKTKVLSNTISDIELICENSAPKFKKKVSALLDSITGDVKQKNEKVEVLFQHSLAELTQELGDVATTQLTDWAKKSSESIESDFSKISESLKLSDVDFDPEFNIDVVNEIADQQESVLEKIESLTLQAEQLESLNNEQLAQIDIRREEIEKSLEQLHNAHAEAIEAFNYLQSNYQPRYIDRPSKMGEAMKRVGSALDIAMLAIPAVGWEKGATMLANKAATLAGKSGQLAQIGSKVLTAGSNSAKLLASTDTAKDMATLIGMGTKQLSAKEAEETKTALMRLSQNEGFSRQNGIILNPQSPNLPEPSQKPSLFDYLSLSYWFGKFGEWIDPPTREIDREYESRYREAREQCEHRAFMLARQRIEEERELGRIKNDTYAREMENKFRQESLKREQAICEKELQKLAKKKEIAITKSIMESAVLQFRDAVKKVEKQIVRQLEPIFDNVYDQILSAASQSAFVQLEQIKGTLESLLIESESRKQEAEKPLTVIDEYLEVVK